MDKLDLNDFSLENLKKIQEALEELEGSVGWGLVKNFLESQLRSREGIIYNPSKGFDGAFNKEFVCGEVSFGKFILRVPELLRKNYDMTATMMKEQEMIYGQTPVEEIYIDDEA